MYSCIFIFVGCVDGYYRDGNMCQPCPARSNSSGPLSTSCACETGRITAGGESTTTGDECSGEWIYTL